MRLNLLMCTFRVNTGKFLGFLLTPDGIQVNPEKVRAILGMHLPKTSKELQWLTKRITALSRFISKLDDKCSPFFKTLRKEEYEKAFQQLKELLTSPSLLQGLQEGEKLLLYLEEREDALSSMLVREEGKRQWSVYYVSITLRGAELKYHILKKLVLALITSTRKLRPCF